MAALVATTTARTRLGPVGRMTAQGLDQSVQTSDDGAWTWPTRPLLRMPWQKSFDVEDALRKAGAAFWDHGYEATSMADLLEAMGIQKGSFYDTYGSKKEVYLRSLEQYATTRFEEFRALAADHPPKAALRVLIEAIHDECAGPEGHKGCMVVNGALELAHSDTAAQRLVARTLEAHEEAYLRLIEAGQEAGEISRHLDAPATAKALLALVMGMRVYSRAGSPRTTLRTLADQALALLER